MAVSTFEGLDPVAVVGAEGEDGEFYAYLSEDVSQSRADEIMARLVRGKARR